MNFRGHMLKLMPVVISSLVIGFLCAQKSIGFILYLVIPAIFIWLIYSSYLLRRNPSERISLLLKFGIWCLSLTIVFCMHHYYRIKSREVADSVAIAVSVYYKTNGVYPLSLANAGINLHGRGGAWRITYGLISEKPFLSYPSTFDPFDKYVYNFVESKWEFYPD